MLTTPHALQYRQDGSFAARGIPTGSYVVEVSHPVFTFEPQRVDVSSKGKIRARRVNVNQVQVVMCYGGGWCGVLWSVVVGRMLCMTSGCVI